MKTSTIQARNLRPTIGRIVTVLVVALAVGGMAMTPALGAKAHRDKGWHKGERQSDRDWREYRPAYQQPYYSQPVYVPPPVYYAPQQSPGISFFFPLDFRR